MSQNTFKVATNAADACGQAGARKVAYKAAAIQVIKNGGDRFIIVGDQSSSTLAGGTFNAYGGFQTYNHNNQDMIVRTLKKGDPDYGNGLSARQTLGADWQAQVTKGVGVTCTG